MKIFLFALGIMWHSITLAQTFEEICWETEKTYLDRFANIIAESWSPSEKAYYEKNMKFFDDSMDHFCKIANIYQEVHSMSQETYVTKQLRGQLNLRFNERFFKYVDTSLVPDKMKKCIPWNYVEDLCLVGKHQALDDNCVNLISRFFYRVDGTPEKLKLILKTRRKLSLWKRLTKRRKWTKSKASYDPKNHTLTIWIKKKSDKKCGLGDFLNWECSTRIWGAISNKTIHAELQRYTPIPPKPFSNLNPDLLEPDTNEDVGWPLSFDTENSDFP